MAFIVDLAGRFRGKTLAVLHRGSVARTENRRLEVGADLVCSGNDINGLAAVDLTGKTVAAPVDVYDLAGFGDGICA